MKMVKSLYLVLIAVFSLLGLALMCAPGFGFSALLCFGCAALLLIFFLLQNCRWPKAKLLQRILLVIVCVGITAAAITGGIVIHAASGAPDTNCDYLIVLGAGVNGTHPSLILSDRLRAAHSYLTAHPETICVVSGGQGPGEDITEADCMADWLIAKGIPEDRIWREDKSTSTRENLLFSMDLIENMTGTRPKTAGLLSNEFHLFRAAMEAKAQGLAAIGIPARTSWLSLKINYILREIPAVWYYALRNLI